MFKTRVAVLAQKVAVPIAAVYTLSVGVTYKYFCTFVLISNSPNSLLNTFFMTLGFLNVATRN